MLKNRKLLGILLSIFMVLAIGIGGFAFDYKYTQESGAGFFVDTADKSDALENTCELRQIVNDLGTLLGHSKMDGLYPKDGTTGGTLAPTGITNIVFCSNYDHPDDAITAISSANKTLLVTEAETCDTNFTVPANVTVRFERGGKWTINTGVTVTFNGQIDAGLWQIFAYTGTGTLAGNPKVNCVYPQWWGAKGDWDEDAGTGTDDHNAINTAIAFASASGIRDVNFPTAKYLIGKDRIIVYSNQRLLFNGSTLRKNDRHAGNISRRMIQSYDWAVSPITNIEIRDVILWNDGEVNGISATPSQSANLGLYHSSGARLINIESKYSPGDCIAIYGTSGGDQNRLQDIIVGSGWGQNAISIVSGNFIWDNVQVVGTKYDGADPGMYIDIENDNASETTTHWMNAVISPQLTFADLHSLADGIFAHSVYMTNCKIGLAYKALNFLATNNVSAKHIHIGSGNYIAGSSAGGIALSIQNVSGIQVADCFIDASAGSAGNKYAIYIKNTVSDLRLSNVKITPITAAGDYGLFAYDAGTTLTGSLIEGCKLGDVYLGGSGCAENIFKDCEIKTLTLVDVATIDNVFDCGTRITTIVGDIGSQVYRKIAFDATSAELAAVISDETGSGAVVLGTAPSFTTSIATPIVIFPATQAPSAGANTLDDYEESVHVTTLVCSTSGDYTLDAGSDTLGYIKIGKKVTIQGRIAVTGANTPNGDLRLSIPFAIADLAEYAEVSIGNIVIFNHGGTLINPFLIADGGLSYLLFKDISDTGTISSINNTDVDTAFVFYISVTYIAAN